MLTNPAFRRRAIMRRVADRVEGFDRFVDCSVIIKVVAPAGASPADITTDNGIRLRVLREHRRGGVLDTKSNPPRLLPGRWGPGDSPQIWTVSEDQERLVLHPDDAPRGQLVVGSEGAGKTTALVIWHFLRWMEHVGEYREGLQTAPTLDRLGNVQREFHKLWRPNWMRYVQRDSFRGLELCDRTRIRFVSTYRQSAAQGSPIQGFNSSWAGRDETQDQVDVHEDIENRGRASKRGGTYYKQFGTATAKDDPDWRTLRDKLEAARDANGNRLWSLSWLYARRSPFIAEEFWATKKQTMSPREYARRVECKDVGPERATYPDWSRETNIITLPDIGGPIDVTAHELRASGPQYRLLVGHDPGTLWDVSLFLRAFARNEQAYLRGKERPFWVVVGELNTEQSTTEVHIAALLAHVRKEYRLNLLAPDGGKNPDGNQILVRADPADTTDKVNPNTHKTVYTQFANAGIRIKPAAYNADNDGHGKVPKDPGIEVVNTLICNAEGQRRLFVLRNPDGSPAAPKLVAALEQAERDYAGKAEMTRKGATDTSHWPAALRYALWAIERPRLQSMRARNA